MGCWVDRPPLGPYQRCQVVHHALSDQEVAQVLRGLRAESGDRDACGSTVTSAWNAAAAQRRVERPLAPSGQHEPETVAGAYYLAMAARIDRRADTGSARRQIEESMRQIGTGVPDIVDGLRDELGARPTTGGAS